MLIGSEVAIGCAAADCKSVLLRVNIGGSIPLTPTFRKIKELTMKCSSVHKMSGVSCIREKGHEGDCYSKACRNSTDGSITRTEWYSKNEVFLNHKQYKTTYPINSKIRNNA